MEHKKQEEDLEDEIASMEDRLADVKSDLESRMRDLEITFEEDESPSKVSTVKMDSSPFSIPSAPMSSCCACVCVRAGPGRAVLVGWPVDVSGSMAPVRHSGPTTGPRPTLHWYRWRHWQ